MEKELAVKGKVSEAEMLAGSGARAKAFRGNVINAKNVKHPETGN
jgi:hypothetical protein